MQIIDRECKACAAFEQCSTNCMKGSLMCLHNRTISGQTKADMARKMDLDEAYAYMFHDTAVTRELFQKLKEDTSNEDNPRI